MNDFKADEQAKGCPPELAARYNGMTHVLRPTINSGSAPSIMFRRRPNAGHMRRSWARFEAGQWDLLSFGTLPTTLGSWHGRRRSPSVQGAVRSDVAFVRCVKDQR